MAETAKNIELEAEDSPPFYVNYDVKSREQFLLDLGNYTPPQLEVFQTLCKSWELEIPYARFLSQLSGAVKNVAAEVEKVLSRMQERRCGIIKLHYDSQGEMVYDSIVMSVPDSPRFHYFNLLNKLEAFFSNVDEHLPYEEYLASQDVRPLDVQTLAEGGYAPLFDDSRGGCKIFRVRLEGANQALLLAAGTGNRFIGYSLIKMRDALTRPNFAMEVARLLDLSMNDMKKRAESRDPLLVLGMAQAIEKLKDDPLVVKRVQVSQAFFDIIAILVRFVAFNLEDAKRKKNAEEDKMKDISALTLMFEQEKNPVVCETRYWEILSSFRDKYGNGFDEFCREFAAKTIEPRDEQKISVIIYIGKQYIHRSNFYQVFLGRLYIFREQAEQYLLATMQRLLRTGNRDNTTLFLNKENFEKQLMAYLRSTDPLLGDIFAAPKVFSEALMYTLREKRKIRDMNLVKEELEKFLQSETMQFKSLPVILQFSAVEIFNRSYSHLSWWRQLLMKLTGRYKSYQNQYARTSPSQARKAGDSSSSGSSRGSSQSSSLSQARGAAQQKKKNYTKHQQENAWSEFSKTIKPK
jgi:hypothetical protein